MKTYYVYIMASPLRAIYIGMTNNLVRRVWEYKEGVVPGFTSQYGISRLVYIEEFADVHDAIGREKQLKGWRREKKLALIEGTNPSWRDLSETWQDGETQPDG